MAEISLSWEDAVKMQNELITGYMTEEFQRKLWTEFGRAGGDDVKKMQAKVECCADIQYPVIAKYGFEASRKGVQASLKAFGPYNDEPTVAEKNALMMYLIDPSQQQEIADKDLKAPRGVADSRRRTPNPDEWPEGTGKIWHVVGGEKTGGITVRKEESTKSPEYPEKLEHGALIEQVERVGERIHYQKLNDGGAGPDIGWVSTAFKGKPLVEPLYFVPEESELVKEQWRVTHDRIAKRDKPDKDAKMVGGAKKGDILRGFVHQEGDVKWLKASEPDPANKGKDITVYVMIDGSSVGLGQLLEKM